ncbi:hypothetical protein V500_06978 [Pseudogymnoascus sp. VKM F-4518 (FW-2643)]|nr:hypothetical protein V500_06978 [Pseudogymnoascus sp. VKM F-4518 (FW-2643)]
MSSPPPPAASPSRLAPPSPTQPDEARSQIVEADSQSGHSSTAENFLPLPQRRQRSRPPRIPTHPRQPLPPKQALLRSPPSPPGTGTGNWAIEMGDLYPTGLIEATDLSPIQPSAVPANVQFIIDDAEQADWAIPENHYDFVHTRILEGCFLDMGAVIATAFKHTKPGGYLECQELNPPPHCDDGTMPPDWPFLRYVEKLQEASLEIGRELDIAPKLRGWFEDAGFVDVQQRVFKVPLGRWPKDPTMKDLGHWWAENMSVGLAAFSLAYFSRVLGWSTEEIELYLVDVRKSLTDRDVHAYHRMYVVWGRKPEVGEVVPGRAPAA